MNKRILLNKPSASFMYSLNQRINNKYEYKPVIKAVEDDYKRDPFHMISPNTRDGSVILNHTITKKYDQDSAEPMNKNWLYQTSPKYKNGTISFDKITRPKETKLDIEHLKIIVDKKISIKNEIKENLNSIHHSRQNSSYSSIMPAQLNIDRQNQSNWIPALFSHCHSASNFSKNEVSVEQLIMNSDQKQRGEIPRSYPQEMLLTEQIFKNNRSESELKRYHDSLCSRETPDLAGDSESNSHIKSYKHEKNYQYKIFPEVDALSGPVRSEVRHELNKTRKFKETKSCIKKNSRSRSARKFYDDQMKWRNEINQRNHSIREEQYASMNRSQRSNRDCNSSFNGSKVSARSKVSNKSKNKKIKPTKTFCEFLKRSEQWEKTRIRKIKENAKKLVQKEKDSIEKGKARRSRSARKTSRSSKRENYDSHSAYISNNKPKSKLKKKENKIKSFPQVQDEMIRQNRYKIIMN